MSHDMRTSDAPPSRAYYRFFTPLQTRWSDNDMLGHLNNVVYNRFFEAIVVAFFRTYLSLNVVKQPVVPIVAEILTRFRRPLSFPETVDGALKVTHVGKSSVRYELALFRQGEDISSAHGHWVHVFTDRRNNAPSPIPDDAREVFEHHLRLGDGDC